MVLVQVQNVDRCKQKRQKMLVRVPKMDRYEHSAMIQLPWHCANTESKVLRSEATSPDRRTAASAAESPPRGRGFRGGVTVNRRSPPIPERENPAVKAGLFACTGNGTIIEPILTIFWRCIYLVLN